MQLMLQRAMQSLGPKAAKGVQAPLRGLNIGASIITTILGVPYYNHSIIYPPNPILIIEAPTLLGGLYGRALKGGVVLWEPGAFGFRVSDMT